MHIHHVSTKPIELPTLAELNPATAAQPAGVAAAGTPAAASSYTPSAQLVQLTQSAGQQDEVRPAVVAAARARLAAGQYATTASAEQTAAALLSSVE